MRGRLLVFGGTSEARELLESGIPAVCSVATDYGAKLLENLSGVQTIVGRMDASDMAEFIRDNGFTCVVDATHPYAAEASRNIKLACGSGGTPLLRVLRESTPCSGCANVKAVSSCEEAARFINEAGGNVLLTVGSKELNKFTGITGYKKRLFARVLPLPEVISRCAELGFDAGHIIAMQGPFSQEMNEALIKMTNASILVTKDGGPAGGAREKINAAAAAGATVILVRRKDEYAGCSVEYAVRWARKQLELPPVPFFPMWIDLYGKLAVIAGGGTVALRRARILKKCGAAVKVVSPVFRKEFTDEGFEVAAKKWEERDLEGAYIAVAATDDRNVNSEIGVRARNLGIPVSVADAASECTFLFPSLISEGDAAVSISSGGFSPRLVRNMADRLREVWPSWVEGCKRNLNNKEGEKP